MLINKSEIHYMKCILVASAIVFTSLSPSQVIAQDFSDIADTAKKITVRIEGATQGSGVLVKKEGNTYTVLTAWHVIKDVNPSEELAIITNDGKEHQRIKGSAKQLGVVDLAKLEFKSPIQYKIITPKNKINTKSGKKLFVGGFPLSTSAVPYRLFRFLEGNVVASADIPISGGYQLLYSNQTLPGMSGGAVLDENSNLIAIHGRGEISINETRLSNVSIKTGTNQGIPIKYYFNQSANQKSIAKGYGDYLALAKSQITEYKRKSDIFYSEKRNQKREKSKAFVKDNIYLIDNAVINASKAVDLKGEFESHLILGTAFWYKKNAYPFLNELPDVTTPKYDQWKLNRKEIRDNVTKHLGIALRYKPENIDALLYRGSVLEDIETGGGIGDFTRALSLQGDNLDARKKRANAYFGLAMAEGENSVERKKSYLRLALEDNKYIFSNPNAIEAGQYLNRGIIRLQLFKVLPVSAREERIEVLDGACTDADTARKGGASTFNLIWKDFRNECAKINDLIANKSKQSGFLIPSTLDPGYKYIHPPSVCQEGWSTHKCNFARQVIDVRGFAAYLRCEMTRGRMTREKAVWQFKQYRYTPGLSEEAYLTIFNLGGIDAPVVKKLSELSCDE